MKKSRRRLVLLLGLALLLALAAAQALAAVQPGEPVTVYSRSITLPVEPDESPEAGTLYILYDPNGGSGPLSMDGDYAKGAKIALLSANDLGFTPPTTPEGVKAKVFAGWSTKKNATKPEAAYAPGRTVTLKSSLTLYAVWVQEGKETPVSLIYHYNTGKGKKHTVNCMEGETVELLSLGGCGWSEPSNKQFLGWSTSDDAASPKFYPGDSVIVTGSKNHLYAVWETNGTHIRINKYITNKKWDSDGELKRFKSGDTVRFNIEVSNTGTETIKKVIVYEALKGAKIKKGGGYHVDSDGDAVIKDLAPQETVTVKATYVVKTADLYKHHLANTAYAYYGKGEKSDSVRIPVRHLKSTAAETEPVPTTTTVTVYADRSLALPLNRIRSLYELANPSSLINIVYGDAALYTQQAASGMLGGGILITNGDEQMDSLDIQADPDANPQRQDRILSSTRVDIAENAAVLAGRVGTQVRLEQLPSMLTSNQVRIAVSTGADTAGGYAREVFEYLGLEESALRASGALIETTGGDAVLSSIITGAADLGITPSADAIGAGLAAAGTVSDAASDPLVYPAAILRGTAAQAAAQNFLSYLRTAEARRVFESLGYQAGR